MFLGKELILEEQFNLFNNFSVLLRNEKLIISKQESYPYAAREIYENWLREQANEYIPKRVRFLANKHGFQFNKLSIRSQKTRWGSCSSKGNLSFNYKLMSLDKRAVDYVIVHELCHLKELNHSKKFWQLIEEIIPNYKNYKKLMHNLN